MATTTKTPTKTTTKTVDENAFWTERVPVTIPLNYGNPDDQTMFVSVGNYSAQIQRGVEVMVPRNAAAVIEQSLKAESEAFMRRQRLQREYEEEARKI